MLHYIPNIAFPSVNTELKLFQVGKYILYLKNLILYIYDGD